MLTQTQQCLWKVRGTCSSIFIDALEKIFAHCVYCDLSILPNFRPMDLSITPEFIQKPLVLGCFPGV